MQYIQFADYFVSHPIDTFIPYKMLTAQLCNSIYKFPATTDSLDGLNKPLASNVMKYYQRMFNRIAYEEIGRTADFNHRRYITQVARFDPSKGIPSVLASYAKLRKLYENKGKQVGVEDKDLAEQKEGEAMIIGHSTNEIPQLILCGHGSIDGVYMYQHCNGNGSGVIIAVLLRRNDPVVFHPEHAMNANADT